MVTNRLAVHDVFQKNASLSTGGVSLSIYPLLLLLPSTMNNETKNSAQIIFNRECNAPAGGSYTYLDVFAFDTWKHEELF